MAASLIKTLQPEESAPNKPKVAGRIITTLPKAKELRPIIEKLITLAKRAIGPEAESAKFSTSAPRNSDAWKSWKESETYSKWVAARSPVVLLRRRAFSKLRDKDAVKILFDVLAPRFESRQGGYTRVVRVAAVRLGDAGEQALIEFVGENDRKKLRRQKKRAPMAVAPATETPAETPAVETPASQTPPTDQPSS